MALPGNGTILATSADRKSLYERAAQRIVAMAKEFARRRAGPWALAARDRHGRGLRQRDDPRHGHGREHEHGAAHPGHRPRGGRAVHDEADRRAEPPDAEHLQGPPASKYHIEDVARAGGMHTILGEVARGRPGLLDLSCPTVTGKTLGENIAEYDIRADDVDGRGQLLARVRPGGERTHPGVDRPERRRRGTLAGRRVSPSSSPRARTDRRRSAASGLDGFDAYDVIRTVDNAYSQTGGLSMLYGNLAPDGAVVKTAGVDPKMLRHTGPAVIFESEEDAYNGIVFGKVKAGDVVVIRNEGPKGGPGMQEMLAPTTAIKGVGLGDSAPWSPTAGSRAARPAPRSATSAPRRPSAGRSACCRTATSSRSTSPPAGSSSGFRTKSSPPAGPRGNPPPPGSRAATWRGTPRWPRVRRRGRFLKWD